MRSLRNFLTSIMMLVFLPLSVALAESRNADVKVEILPEMELNLGDIMQVRLTSSVAGHLILIDLDKDGKATRLFPGVCEKPNLKLRANAPLTMPTVDYGCEFPATEPGEGRVIAIITEKPVKLKYLASWLQTGDKIRYRSIEVEGVDDKLQKNPKNNDLASIVRRLLVAWESGAVDSLVPWSLGASSYRIIK